MDSGRFRFGLFEFDTATRELRREGVLVRLQSQPAQVLSCLVEQHGEVVSRENLCGAVWGDGTFVDFERGLNFCIAQIRSALNDDSTSPRYVRTIPKRGYQFIVPVEHISAAPEPIEATSARGRFSTAVAVSCALVVAIAFFVGYRLRSRQVSNQSPIVAVVRFDNETGDASMVRFSDGFAVPPISCSTSSGLNMVGSCLGRLGNGICSSRYGRRKVLTNKKRRAAVVQAIVPGESLRSRNR